MNSLSARQTIVDLLRHGETQGGNRFNGSTDVPLTSSGLTDMREAVTGAGLRWDRIISSPLSRCGAFARELADTLGLPLDFEGRFREMHFGAWEGRTAAELMETRPEELGLFWQDPRHNGVPGGESLDAFEERVLAAWHDAALRHAGQRLLLVTHAGVIRLLLCHVQGLPGERLLDIEVAHASLHSILIRHSGSALQYPLGGRQL